MKRTSANINEVYAKKVRAFEGMAARAELRKCRALSLGNMREAAGAQRSVEDARHNAALLRAKMETCTQH